MPVSTFRSPQHHRIRPLPARWLMALFLAILIGSPIGVGLGISQSTRVAAQDREMDDLVHEVAALRAELDTLQEEVATLRSEVADLRGSNASVSTTTSQATAEETSVLIGTWIATESGAHAEAGAYKYTWDPIIIQADGTYAWEGPYAAGTWDVTMAGRDNKEIVLNGTNGLRCTARYFANTGQLEVRMEACPGFIVESQYDPGDWQELDAGRTFFVAF